MKKKLHEMTLEELWELFPIFLVPHNEAWKEWFREEKEHLEDLLPSGMIKGIHHIGSTCIPTIMAKSIVDILVVVNEGMADVKRVLLDCGYLLMSESPARVSLNKGYTEEGFSERVFHIHLRLPDDIDELYFRDYLLEHEDVAKAYDKLKIEAAAKFKHNRDLYTDSKTAFIKKYTGIAKERYEGRYL